MWWWSRVIEPWVWLWGCRSGLGVVVCVLVSAWWWSRGCGCGVADLGWVWWFAFWSRRGGGAVGVVVGLPVD
uniref:Uncharacterized protein n=1 Tax=Fagus sylvatica TaxID=28930 RepID=A0A2N9EZ81_FAGSY